LNPCYWRVAAGAGHPEFASQTRSRRVPLARHYANPGLAREMSVTGQQVDLSST
jgi:hypothetical protein